MKDAEARETLAKMRKILDKEAERQARCPKCGHKREMFQVSGSSVGSIDFYQLVCRNKLCPDFELAWLPTGDGETVRCSIT